MSTMDLTPAEFKRVQETLLKMEEVGKKDPVYWISTFCYTFNPKVKKGSPHLRFKLFDFQKRLVRDILYAIRNGEDLFIEKCREMGATYTVLATFLWLWLYEPGTNILIGSRKQDYVDNRRGGTTGNKEESLFGKIDYMLSRLPGFMLPKGFTRNRHFTFMSLVNPQNGNVIAGESSNPNFSRGSRYRCIFLDEFAFWENGASVWGATADTTNCRIVATTPGDKPSKAKRLRFGKDGEKIKVITLRYNLDPRKTSSWLREQRERRSKEDFEREIMINWETSITGRVYPEIMNAKVSKNFVFIPGEQLYCSWDFGLDGTAFSFWQLNKKNGKWRLIDSYENKDQVIQFFFPFFGQPIDSKFTYSDEDLEAIKEISKYPPAIHFGDPDIDKRSFQKKDTSTRTELSKIGIYVQTTTPNRFRVRREATKVELQKGIEIREIPRNDYFLECIKMSRYPKRNEDSQSTQPVSLPVHDWTSHMRTSMEYFFLNVNIWQHSDVDVPAWANKKPAWLTKRNSFKTRRR